MRSLSSSIVLSALGKRCQRGRPADRRRTRAVGLRAGLGRVAGGELVENLLEARRREILVIIVIDLRHRGVHAGAETLDLDPGEFSIGGDVELLADPGLT